MKIYELINILQEYDKNIDIMTLYDGTAQEINYLLLEKVYSGVFSDNTFFEKDKAIDTLIIY